GARAGGAGLAQAEAERKDDVRAVRNRRLCVSDKAGALVLFSGGQDSTVCLAYALDRFARVETVGFDYGQRHAVELECRQNVRNEIVRCFPAWEVRLGPGHVIDIASFCAVRATALTPASPL